MRQPCETCDFHGPELPTTARDLRELHRAIHGFIDAFVGPISDWQMRVFDRVMALADGVRVGLTLPRGRTRR